MNYKNGAILVFALCVSQLSYSQTEFRFGLKGSANLGWIQPTSKNIERDGLKLGFSYGIMGDFYFKPNYAISGELLISQVNGGMSLVNDQIFTSDTSNSVVSNLSYAYKIQYAEIPVSLKLRTKEIGYLTYWANFGAAPCFLISARASLSGNLPASIASQDPTDYRVNDDEGDPFTTNNFDDQVFLIRMPLIIGGGVEYKIAGSTSLVGGIRLSNSFTDMFVKDKNVSAKNNFISITVGVFF
jgi:hypothetical protein